MSEATPEIPSTQPNGSSVEGAKNTVFSSAQSAMETVQNHPVTQNVSDTVQNGAVGQAYSEQKNKTASEFRDLQNHKTIPEQPTATGQPLTHYHSMFYRLLSWKNPRATAISFALAVSFIFATRYLHVERYLLKILYTVLGVSALAEVAGKAVLGHGLATQMRPRKYLTIPRDSLERFMDDFEQLINFVVIEFQRIIFAENVYVTVGAFFSTFISYFLIKFVPFWGLSLIATSILYLAPLIYIKNQEFIDEKLHIAHDIMSKQASQVRELTGQYTGKASEQVRSYGQQASTQLQGLYGQAKDKAGYRNMPDAPKTSPMPEAPKQEPAAHQPEPAAYQSEPAAHQSEPTAHQPEPLAAMKRIPTYARNVMEALLRAELPRGLFNENGSIKYDDPAIIGLYEKEKDLIDNASYDSQSQHDSVETLKGSEQEPDRASIKEPEPEHGAEPFPFPIDYDGDLAPQESQHKTGYGDGIVYNSATTDEKAGPPPSAPNLDSLQTNVGRADSLDDGKGPADRRKTTAF